MESGLQSYLKQINETPLLTEQEEKELAERVAAGDGAARDRMVRANLRLVVNIAKNYSRRGMPLIDLIEEGNIGLIKAVENFDPSFGNRFSTYASWWIKQAIKRALINAAQPIHIPAYMVEMISRYRQAMTQLDEKLGRPPTLDEIAEHMAVRELETKLGRPPVPGEIAAYRKKAIRKTRIIRDAVRAYASRAQTGTDDDGTSLSDNLPDKTATDPCDAVLDADDLSAVRGLLERIDPRSAIILKLRFGPDDTDLTESDLELLHLAADQPMTIGDLKCHVRGLGDGAKGDEAEDRKRADVLTLKEIGRLIGLTRERVRQLERDTLRALHDQLESADPTEK